MHGQGEESRRRGEDRGGEGRMEWRRDGEVKLTGGRPSKLLSIFIPPVETLKEETDETLPGKMRDKREVQV